MVDIEQQAGLSADELEAEGTAPWHGKQPLEALARRFKGSAWVPLDDAIRQLQFWQRRDYEHSRASVGDLHALEVERDKALAWAREQHACADRPEPGGTLDIILDHRNPQ